jgi:hypothetical protein
MHIREALHPHSPETFLAEYWRRKPMLIRRGIGGFYDDVLTQVQLEEVLIHNRMRYPELRLVKDGNKVSKETLMEWGWMDKIVPLDTKPAALVPLYEAYDNGYTIMLRAERVCNSISAFCREFELWLHHQSIGEVILTPANTQGSLYEPPGGDPATPLSERVGEPIVDCCMNPGDLLYVPREYPHEALADADSPSLHLSVAVFPTRWRDLMLESLRAGMDADPRFEEPLPAAFLCEDSGALKNTLKGLWRSLAETADFKKSVDRLGIEFCSGLRPLADDHFGQLTRLNRLTADTLLERRPGMFCHMARNGSSLKLGFPGNNLKLPLSLFSVIQGVIEREGSFTPRDLPGKLDEAGRVVLMKHLIKAGLLRFAAVQ